MAVTVLVLGESGTGKSASLRNFKKDEVLLINVANKPLPFKGHFETVNTDSYRHIKQCIKDTKKKVIVIDDAQYLMANEFMRRATERGYDKFTEIAQNFWDLVRTASELGDDKVVYVLAHIERDANGNEKIKTIGKMLDEKITIEGMFTIVLKTNVTDGVYSFVTQNSGHDTVKSPIGLFKNVVIDNDLHAVDEDIRAYYDIDVRDWEKIDTDIEVPFTAPEKPTEAPKPVEDELPKPVNEGAPKRARKPRGEFNINDSVGDGIVEMETPKDDAPAMTEPPARRRRRS